MVQNMVIIEEDWKKGISEKTLKDILMIVIPDNVGALPQFVELIKTRHPSLVIKMRTTSEIIHLRIVKPVEEDLASIGMKDDKFDILEGDVLIEFIGNGITYLSRGSKDDFDLILENIYSKIKKIKK